MSNFFSDHDSEAIVRAIGEIEESTVGELRVHIEDHCEGSPMDRAIEVFNKLAMYRTAQKTGVLIYLASEDHKLAIIGDKGIHDILGDGYWQQIMSEMKEKFIGDSIFSGVLHGVLAVGKELKNHFPELRKPKNELSNEISYGKI